MMAESFGLALCFLAGQVPFSEGSIQGSVRELLLATARSMFFGTQPVLQEHLLQLGGDPHADTGSLAKLPAV